MGILDKLTSYLGAAPAASPSAPAAPSGASPIPADYIARVAKIESGGNPHAKAPTSSACGLFQFTDSTWASIRQQAPGLGLTPDGRMDAEQSTRAFVWLAESDGTYFRRLLGRDPEPFERYLLHFLGAPRGTQVCAARDDKPLEAIFGPAGYSAVASANKFLAGWTAGQLKAWSRSRLSA